MFGKLKEKLTGGAQRLAGRTDLLEGIAAACAMVSAADGDVEDAEVESMLAALLVHETLSKAFSTSQIETTVNKMIQRAKGGLAGKIGLKREIEEAKAKSSTDDLEMLYVIAIDVANSDGEMEPQEKKVLQDIGKILGFQLESYL
jgi:tellurite resistance protein TerB